MFNRARFDRLRFDGPLPLAALTRLNPARGTAARVGPDPLRASSARAGLNPARGTLARVGPDPSRATVSQP